MFGPITVAATSGVPAEDSGLAGGLLNTTRQIGGACGLAMLGTMAASAAGPAGYGTALAVGAAVFLVTAVAGFCGLPADLMPRRQHGDDPAPTTSPGRPRPSRAAAG
jgi:hypothetical protein